MRTHGESRPITKEYRTWSGMKMRCYNKNQDSYPNYGGKGIKVCDRWLHSFENFLEDMGRAPSKKHTIDRLENSKDYSPENCKWSTQAEQNRNKKHPDNSNHPNNLMIEFNGKTQSLKQWAKKFNLNYEVTYNRIAYRGLSLQQVINYEKFGINPLYKTSRGIKKMFKKWKKKTIA